MMARNRHGWVVRLYDWLYRRWHRLDRQASAVGPALRIEVHRARRRHVLPDGTRVVRGERLGTIHLDNRRVAALHRAGACRLDVGLAFRRALVASLEELARAASTGPLADVRAFSATT